MKWRNLPERKGGKVASYRCQEHATCMPRYLKVRGSVGSGDTYPLEHREARKLPREHVMSGNLRNILLPTWIHLSITMMHKSYFTSVMSSFTHDNARKPTFVTAMQEMDLRAGIDIASFDSPVRLAAMSVALSGNQRNCGRIGRPRQQEAKTTP